MENQFYCMLNELEKKQNEIISAKFILKPKINNKFISGTNFFKMSNVIKHNNASGANVLMCKQWWKVCWMYGDQEKYYRQLYAKRATSTPIASLGANDTASKNIINEPRNYEITNNADATWLAVTQQRFDNE